MTLDEAIIHCEEIVEKNETDARHRFNTLPLAEQQKYCLECAEEYRQLAEWLKELKQLREQTRWIPVSERLPETNDDVLVYDDTYMFIAWYQRKGMWQGWNSLDDNSFGNIIAWMPLPEPYRAESEEKE